MKTIAAAIMMFIMLFSAFRPCCVNDSCGQDQVTVNEPTDHSSSDHTKQDGNCSPFFTCGYCSGFVLAAKQIQAPIPEFKTHEYVKKIIKSIPDTYVSSLFQPPRTINI